MTSDSEHPPLPPASDTLPILERVQAGDPRALDDLFMHYHPFIARLVRAKTAGMVLTRFEHDDLVQESVIGLLSYRALFVPGRESELRALAVQIVTNKIADGIRHWNARKRAGKADPDETVGEQPARRDPTPSRIASRAEFMERIRNCLDKLPEQQREVLVLRIQHRRSQASVAEQLGKSPEAVQMIEQRARKALKECMKANGGTTSFISA